MILISLSLFLMTLNHALNRYGMGLLPNTQNCGLRMRREYRGRFPRHGLQRKPLVSDPGMHHGTCVAHVPCCMSISLTRGGGKTFPTIPAHAQPAILRIWQEAHSALWVIVTGGVRFSLKHFWHLKKCVQTYTFETSYIINGMLHKFW